MSDAAREPESGMTEPKDLRTTDELEPECGITKLREDIQREMSEEMTKCEECEEYELDNLDLIKSEYRNVELLRIEDLRRELRSKIEAVCGKENNERLSELRKAAKDNQPECGRESELSELRKAAKDNQPECDRESELSQIELGKAEFRKDVKENKTEGGRKNGQTELRKAAKVEQPEGGMRSELNPPELGKTELRNDVKVNITKFGGICQPELRKAAKVEQSEGGMKSELNPAEWGKAELSKDARVKHTECGRKTIIGCELSGRINEKKEIPEQRELTPTKTTNRSECGNLKHQKNRNSALVSRFEPKRPAQKEGGGV